MYFNVTFDSSVSSAPAAFKSCVNAVCQYYDSLFTNKVAVSVNVGWGEVAGQSIDAGSLGQSSSFYSSQNYAQVVAALMAQGAPGASTLPASPPFSGDPQVTLAEARALGIANAAGSDGAIGIDKTTKWSFSTTQSTTLASDSYDLFGTIGHELAEVMGRGSDLNVAGIYSVLDLFRYASNGVRQLTTGDPSYFSVDGGKNLLLAFNNFQTGDPTGDLGDWASNIASADSYGYGSAGQVGPVSAVDKTEMAALGWTVTTASAAMSVAASVPTLSAAAAVAAINNGQDNFVAVSDSGANIASQFDGLEALAKNGNLSAITLTSSGLSLSVAQLINDTDALALVSGSYSLTVSDSAANINAGLSSLAALVTAGTLTSLKVTDSSYASITVAAAQMSADTALLKTLSGNYYLTIDATSGSGLTLSGLAGHGTVVALAGAASQYTLTPKGDGAGFTIASSAVSDQIAGITALSFGGTLDFVATTPGGANNITSGNITELYGAVFGREPDVPGLAFYQAFLKANPSVGLTTYATYFLSSGEYTSAHNYPQTTPGENQFITDSYTNLLHRTASASEVSFYYQNVIAPALQNMTPGTAAYASADLAAHALVLTYFSQSTEFLGDVQITASHPADSQHYLYLI